MRHSFAFALPGLATDESLIAAARRRSTGADVHALEALVGSYRLFTRTSREARADDDIVLAEWAELMGAYAASLLSRVADGALDGGEAQREMLALGREHPAP